MRTPSLGTIKPQERVGKGAAELTRQIGNKLQAQRFGSPGLEVGRQPHSRIAHSQAHQPRGIEIEGEPHFTGAPLREGVLQAVAQKLIADEGGRNRLIKVNLDPD